MTFKYSVAAGELTTEVERTMFEAMFHAMTSDEPHQALLREHDDVRVFVDYSRVGDALRASLYGRTSYQLPILRTHLQVLRAMAVEYEPDDVVTMAEIMGWDAMYEMLTKEALSRRAKTFIDKSTAKGQGRGSGR